VLSIRGIGSRCVTMVLMTSLVISSACEIHPAANRLTDAPANAPASRQPATIAQMERLVTPGDPLVKQGVQEALAPTPGYSEFESIKRWAISHCAYKTDADNYGVPDYWATPAESITRGCGDCEDFAILLCSLLRAYGVPADEVYAAVGYTPEGEAHAWLVEKYYTGIWRKLDTQSASSYGVPIDSPELLGFTTTECFNDTHGFYGDPVTARGVYEFESSSPSASASNVYCRYINSGQKITAHIEWLPYSVYWPHNPGIIEPWTFNIYDENSKQVFEWSGKDTDKTLEYKAEHTGIYRIEIVKRDAYDRPARLTLEPQAGWTAGNPLRIDLLRAEITPFPVPVITTQIPAPAPVEATPIPLAPLIVPQDQLVQHALYVLNSQFARDGDEPARPGSNPAAQRHADDMLAHDFVSGWGTDGTTPTERYSLGGGAGTPYEFEYRTPLEWNGTTGSFSDALLSAIEQSERQIDSVHVSAIGFFHDTVSAEILPAQFEMEPGIFNIGIAYNSKYLYIVVLVEFKNAIYSQAPSISNNVLTFSGTNAPGVKLEDVWVTYNELPSPRTPSQISYAAVGYYGERGIAFALDLSLEYSNSKPFAGVGRTYTGGYLDPHSVPTDLPSYDAQAYPVGVLKEALGASPSPDMTNINNFTGFNRNGNDFSFSFDLSKVMVIYGKGVYTVSLGGVGLLGNSYYMIPLSSYTIFVD
jgi:predicted transglutaminase-like cysteine proteinase